MSPAVGLWLIVIHSEAEMEFMVRFMSCGLRSCGSQGCDVGRCDISVKVEECGSDDIIFYFILRFTVGVQ